MPDHQTEIFYEGADGSAWAFTCGYCEQEYLIETQGPLTVSDFQRHACKGKNAIVVVYPPLPGEPLKVHSPTPSSTNDAPNRAEDIDG
jgi:hypothetical protein